MILSSNSRHVYNMLFLIGVIAGSMFLPAVESVLRGTSSTEINDEFGDDEQLNRLHRILKPDMSDMGGGGGMKTDPPSSEACLGDPCGPTSNFNTCEDVSDVAVCGCEYGDEFGDVWPNCFGPAQDCNTVTFDCIDSLCYNWCTDQGCLDESNCDMLLCNPNHRINGPDSMCTCPDGYEMYTINTNSPYIVAAGCGAN